MIEADKLIADTKLWIKDFVIKLGLCPFASTPFLEDRIRYAIFQDAGTELLLEQFWDEIIMLDGKESQELSTTFLIFAYPIEFPRLLQFQEMADELLEEMQFGDDFQLVPFHPEFEFDPSERNIHSALENQSPYAMIHILRSKEVAQGLKAYGSIADLLQENDIRLAHFIAKNV